MAFEPLGVVELHHSVASSRSNHAPLDPSPMYCSPADSRMNCHSRGCLIWSRFVIDKIVQIKDYPDLETTAWTDSYFLPITKIVDCDLETITTRTWIMIDLQIRIEGHIFDLDLIVDGNILIRHGHLQYAGSSGVYM